MAVAVTTGAGATEDVLANELDEKVDEKLDEKLDAKLDGELEAELASPKLVAMLSVSELEERIEVTSVV